MIDENGNWIDDSWYDGAATDTTDDWTDNGDGSFTQNSTGQIYDSAGLLVGQENPDGTWTDLDGNYFNADGTPVERADQWTDNQDGTYTSTLNGDLVYPDGSTEHEDGTWTFADGTTWQPDPVIDGTGTKQTVDQILTKAGAPPVGGSLGSSFGGLGSGSGSSSQKSDPTVQAAITALTNLAKQALASNNQPQQAAIRAAQARLGVPSSFSSSSSSSWLLPLGVAALVFVALRQAS